jgi:signal recognition particle receptor subunit beta
MSFINYAAREIDCKLVYYGPGLSGKTTNLQYIYEKAEPGTKGKLTSLATETDRTLFFDFLNLELGTIGGFNARLHLYTVPGQSTYETSRKLILKGADGVVFVADSQTERLEANIQSYREMEEHLTGYAIDPLKIPLVIQYNKRDLPNVISVDELQKTLNPRSLPWFQAVAPNGTGVFETLKALAKRLVQELQKS